MDLLLGVDLDFSNPTLSCLTFLLPFSLTFESVSSAQLYLAIGELFQDRSSFAVNNCLFNGRLASWTYKPWGGLAAGPTYSEHQKDSSDYGAS